MTKDKSQIVVEEKRNSYSSLHNIYNDVNTSSDKKQEYIEHNQHQKDHQDLVSNQYSVNLQYDPVAPEVFFSMDTGL